MKLCKFKLQKTKMQSIINYKALAALVYLHTCRSYKIRTLQQSPHNHDYVSLWERKRATSVTVLTAEQQLEKTC